MKENPTMNNDNNKFIQPNELLLILFAGILLIVANPGKAPLGDNPIAEVSVNLPASDEMIETIKTASIDSSGLTLLATDGAALNNDLIDTTTALLATDKIVDKN